VYVTLPLVFLSGGLAGAITGFIHTKLKINALLAGILVTTALYSVNLTLMGRSNLPLLDIRSLFKLITFTPDINANTFWILAVFVLIITLLIWYLLKTDFGIAMRATGSSESMIRAMGVNTDRMKILGLALANALTALSGYLICQFQGFTDISMGIAIVIVGLGSVIIGEIFINWFNLTSIILSLTFVLAGAIIFQLVLAVTLDIGVDPNLLQLTTAVFVLLIVSLPRLAAKRAGG
jgi:putative ABC transport system permease protein